MNTMHKKRSTWIAAVVVGLALIAKAEAKAASLLMNKVDIQALRFLQQQRDPEILKSLSKVALKTLFGERALGIDSIVVEGSGLWRWRLHRERALNKGEAGLSTDPLIMQMLLDCESGTVGGTRATIPEGVAKAMVFYLKVAHLRFERGGSMQLLVKAYRQMLTCGTRLWESSDPPQQKERDVRLIAELLRELPDSYRKTVLLSEKQKSLATTWIGILERHERKVVRLLPGAKLAKEAHLTLMQIPSLYDREKKKLLLPTPAKHVRSTKEFYTLPSDPGSKVWMRVLSDSGLTKKKLQDADAAMILSWMKASQVEVFLVWKDSPLKVSPAQWNQRIKMHLSQLGPKNR